jgi:hypothetical protein
MLTAGRGVVYYDGMNKKAKNIKRNDWIICSGDGLPEQVHRNPSKRPGNRVFFRTSRHDHLSDPDSVIETVERPEWARR